MLQLCVSRSIPDMLIVAWEKGCRLSAFDGHLDAEGRRNGLIKEQALMSLRYIIFSDAACAL